MTSAIYSWREAVDSTKLNGQIKLPSPPMSSSNTSFSSLTKKPDCMGSPISTSNSNTTTAKTTPLASPILEYMDTQDALYSNVKPAPGQETASAEFFYLDDDKQDKPTVTYRKPVTNDDVRWDLRCRYYQFNAQEAYYNMYCLHAYGRERPRKDSAPADFDNPQFETRWNKQVIPRSEPQTANRKGRSSSSSVKSAVTIFQENTQLVLASADAPGHCASSSGEPVKYSAYHGGFIRISGLFPAPYPHHCFFTLSGQEGFPETENVTLAQTQYTGPADQLERAHIPIGDLRRTRKPTPFPHPTPASAKLLELMPPLERKGRRGEELYDRRVEFGCHRNATWPSRFAYAENEGGNTLKRFLTGSNSSSFSSKTSRRFTFTLKRKNSESAQVKMVEDMDKDEGEGEKHLDTQPRMSKFRKLKGSTKRISLFGGRL